MSRLLTTDKEDVYNIMEEPYSVEFFTSFVEQLQDVCRNYLHFSQFVEVSGYVCVEIDNLKKERYVLSELLQSSGNVVSESYCTKSFKTPEDRTAFWNSSSQGRRERGDFRTDNNKENISEDDDYNTFTSSSSVGEQYTPDVTSVIGTAEEWVTVPPCQKQQFGTSSDSESVSFASKNAPTTSSPASVVFDEDEVIDLDMFEDDLDMEEENTPRTSEATVSCPQSIPNKQAKLSLSPGTLTTVRNSVKQFRRFHFDRSGGDVDLFSLAPEDLNELLLAYFKEGKKRAGGDLTACTLNNVQKHLHMYLRHGGYPYSIVKDRPFQSSRDFLKKKLNVGRKIVAPKHSPVNDDDIEIMFQTGQLGIQSPESLIHTLWFLNSKYFGIRRPAEHYNLKWGHIQLKVNDEGMEYLERPINASFSLKIFAKPHTPNRCFVNFYKQYHQLRPKLAMDKESAFYLKPNKNSGTWFTSETVIYSYFTYLWRKLVINAGLSIDKKIL
ncbi:transcriptional regulator QRICH1-like isoform X4 [Haliotis asinina]|uniref:transcriptional regulator QRICH1-like isoform X4 n=1 Tax=Haliotis asinina TaxID=109174 RepID=UPI003532011B